MLCDDLEGWDWEGGREAIGRKGFGENMRSSMWHIKYKMSVEHLYTWVWSSEKRISLEVPIWNHQHIEGI